MSSHHCSRAIGGWLAGCGAATAVLGVFSLLAIGIGSGGDVASIVGGIIGGAFPLFLTFLVICLVTVIPAAIVIWVSEKFQTSSIAFFGCAGTVIGGTSVELLRRWFGPPVPAAVHLLFAIAGLAAGLAYWRVAGKYAGRDRQPRSTET